MTHEQRAQRAQDRIQDIARSFQDRFKRGRLQLSFGEYLDLFASDPRRYGRDAATYLLDLFDHFGSEEVVRPSGALRRWRLFDLPWETTPQGRRDALVGQEEVQAEIYRSFANFAREGRPNRVVLTHGPNGSAKSTIAACIMRALEHYSSLEEGALYRFHWVFPNEKRLRGAIGFSESRGGQPEGEATPADSYAHLADEQIDARLVIEVRDHPLFLIPAPERRALIEEAWRAANVDASPPRWLLTGELAFKNQQVLEALLKKYKGSLIDVLKHVQVERYFISRRYRIGAVTLGPQMSVDAGERQVTADQSLAALPTALQATPLYEAFGELVDAAGGLLEFSDLLKRPLDAFKYLQLSVETGEVALSRQNLQLNCVMLGSANEIHLAAFREHPEFPSFRGRMELVRTPYLLSYLDEERIYDNQVASSIKRHVAPHATRVAATFAVLTRLVRPDKQRLTGEVTELAAGLTAIEKADLYAIGRVPERLTLEERKVLHSGIGEIFEESRDRTLYEGISGASPREMQTVLLDASQHPRYACLSPLAVLEEIHELCSRATQFAWLREDVETGGYHDHALFRELLAERLLDVWSEEVRDASGLVDESQYSGLFERYIEHVSAWSKSERLRNRLTGAYEEPDAVMMKEVESLVGWTGEPDEFRRGLLSRMAAWALDNPSERARIEVVFAEQIRKLRDAVFAARRKPLAEICRDIVRMVREQDGALTDDRKRELREVLDAMAKRFGYCDQCACDAAAMLVRQRFHDLIE